MAVPGKKATERFSSITTSVSSDEDLNVYCQSCDRDGTRLPAHGYCTNCSEHLCETCFTVHRRHKLSRHHTLLDKADMPQSMSSLTTSYSDNLTDKPCPKHNIEMIKFFCHYHKSLLCSVCVTLEHTQTSCKVNYIPDVSGQVINSKEYRDILKAIKGMSNETSKILKDMKEMIDTSNKSLKDALTDLKQFRTKINQRLDEVEKQVEKTAKVIQEENIRIMTSVEKECAVLSKSLEASSDAITQLKSFEQANDLFMQLKQAEPMIKDYEQRIATLKSYDAKGYNFEPNEAISNILSKEMSIGQLKGRSLSFKLKSRQISHMDKICVKTSKDIGYCGISGMTLLTPELLVITDYYNMAVKMVDISRKSVLDLQKLESYPWEVTSVSDNDIAVTIPDNQVIQIMSVSGNNLKNKQSLKVDGACTGISCHKGRMVVSFTDPAKIQILHINGTVIQTIQYENVFKFPRYLTTSCNHIYVSDRDMSTITKLNWQGEVKGHYNCRDKLCDLTMSEDGTLFVCYEGNTIREVSEDFTEELTVVKDIQNPQAVCWSAETSTLYTNSWTFSGDENELIKIFKFSR